MSASLPEETGLNLIAAQSLGVASAAGRKATWLSYLRHLEKKGIVFTAASADELLSTALTHRQKERPKQHARRLLGLVEAVIDQLQLEGALPKGRNPATEARFSLDIDCSNDLTTFLTAPQLSALSAGLRSPPGAADTFKDCRDRAMLALALGAGAPPTAISATTVSCIEVALRTNFISLSNTMTSIKRPQSWLAPVLPCAIPALQRYLDLLSSCSRETLAFPGRQDSLMSRSQVFRLIKGRLLLTGLFADSTRLSPQTLRNNYFGLLCQSDRNADEISAAMGWVLNNKEQFRRMRRLWLFHLENNSVRC